MAPESDCNKKLKFSKKERLSKKTDIEAVFSEGRSFVVFPLKFFYIKRAEESSPSILFTVPKRSFKKAVDRNLLKRRLREAYRLDKAMLNIAGIKIAVIYLSKEKLDFNFIKAKLNSGIKRLIEENGG